MDGWGANTSSKNEQKNSLNPFDGDSTRNFDVDWNVFNRKRKKLVLRRLFTFTNLSFGHSPWTGGKEGNCVSSVSSHITVIIAKLSFRLCSLYLVYVHGDCVNFCERTTCNFSTFFVVDFIYFARSYSRVGVVFAKHEQNCLLFSLGWIQLDLIVDL